MNKNNNLEYFAKELESAILVSYPAWFHKQWVTTITKNDGEIVNFFFSIREIDEVTKIINDFNEQRRIYEES